MSVVYRKDLLKLASRRRPFKNAAMQVLCLQWRTKLLGQLTPSALIFPPFPLTPKQSCSLCTPVHFILS